MCFSPSNKLSLCLFPDKSCLDGNRDPASPALTGCCCTSLGKDEAAQTTFIPLVYVKKMKTGLDTKLGKPDSWLAIANVATTQKALEDVKI